MPGETFSFPLWEDGMESGQVSEVVHVRNLDIIQSEDFNTQHPRFQASWWLAGISTMASLSISHLVGFQARSLGSPPSKSTLLPKQMVKKDLSSQFNSVQSLSRVRLCDPMDCSTSGLPVHHQFLEFIQTHVFRVSDAIQPSCLPLTLSPPAPNLSQHQGLFQWVSSSHQVAKVLEFQLQHQSFQWTPRTDLL